MPQIVLNERTVHLASEAFLKTDVDQYERQSLSQLYQPPRTPFSQNIFTSYFHPVNIAKLLRTASLVNISGSSCLQMFFKICVLKVLQTSQESICVGVSFLKLAG